MTKKIFPIQTASACLLKWSWSTLYIDSASTSSCHRVEGSPIDPENFDKFHNVESKLNDRRLMLQGIWPDNNCQYCKRVEDAGGVSDRIAQLELQASELQQPPELSANPTAIEVTPTILEVYFKNTCNMACIYCSTFYSSKWEDEIRKYKDRKTPASMYKNQIMPVEHSQHYDTMFDNLWKYLDKNDRYKYLMRYCILGGEPFILIKELDASLNFWDTHPNPNLTFDITSNLNVPHKRFVTYLDRIKQLVSENKIWKFLLVASLDGWGPEQEYVRYGLNLEQWRENFEYAVSQPWLTLAINSAVSGLTIPQLPTLIEKINYWNTLRSEPIEWSFCTTVQQDNPYIFGPQVFDRYFDRILALLPVDTEQQRITKLQFEGVIKTVNASEKNQLAITDLIAYLDELDVRRQTNWRELFTWLDYLS